MINEGQLVIGTEDQHYKANLIMTFHGNKTATQLPIYGHKGIFVRYGILDIHGERRPVTWTSLATTAEIGE